jgi:single-strand DNA-binding protein
VINQVILVGRMTRNLELRYTSNEKAVGNFTLAINRRFKNQNGEYETDFIDCVVFGKQAETMAQYTKKGDLIGVEGSIQKRAYEDKEGNKRYITEIMVEKITFLQTNKKSETTQTATQNTTQIDPYKEFGEIVENENSLELPF